ncbi:hypothetical protein A4R26_01670 [Niastella populi]|uniref:Uncharacterized protein n=1 Tax=Niastella populi TaxID=550983 RepID=A0A1V9GCZ5_9BACT|nr:hypothetical protein A4R26_01670 [Niastella populi]
MLFSFEARVQYEAFQYLVFSILHLAFGFLLSAFSFPPISFKFNDLYCYFLESLVTEMECCWRASLIYKYENNKLVLTRQKRTVPKWRIFFNFKELRQDENQRLFQIFFIRGNLYRSA